MSVFCGVVSFDAKPVSLFDIEGMLKALTPLTPTPTPVAPTTWAGEDCAFGHALIATSPADLHERQPLVHTSGRYVLTGDIRLDNRDDVFRALGVRPGSEAATTPDSVLALAAYERWGERCVEHLLGAFAFCVWDTESRRLFCARDHLGERLLCYWRGPGLWVFASTPVAVACHSAVPVRPNLAYLADFLVDGFDDTSTYYSDILRLPAATAMTIKAGALHTRRYWAPGPRPMLRLDSGEAYGEVFRETFREVVRCQLPSVGGVGAFMSGGLDSTSVAAFAAAELASTGSGSNGSNGGQLRTFTSLGRPGVTPRLLPHQEADETPYVEAMVRRHPNIVPTFLRPDEQLLLDGLDDWFSACGAPFRNIFNKWWLQAIPEEAAAEGISVVLSGQLGNATISYAGDGLLIELARQGRVRHLVREAGELGATDGRPLWRVLVSQVVMPYLPGSFLRWRRRGHELKRTLSYANPAFLDEQEAWGRAYEPTPKDTRTKYGWTGTLVNTSQRFKVWQSALGPAGVDVRDPTGDVRLIELCLSLPTEQFLQQGCGRRLVRHHLRGMLPDEVRMRTTRGKQTPDWFWHLTDSREQLLDEVATLQGHGLAADCLDLGRIRHDLEALPFEADWRHEYRVSSLVRAVSAGTFLRWFGMQGSLMAL